MLHWGMELQRVPHLSRLWIFRKVDWRGLINRIVGAAAINGELVRLILVPYIILLVDTKWVIRLRRRPFWSSVRHVSRF